MNIKKFSEAWQSALCLAMAGLTACSTAPLNNTAQQAANKPESPNSDTFQSVEQWGTKPVNPEPADPEIAPGFLLTIHSLQDDKLNIDARVDFDGTLKLPYNVTVDATGTTLSQLERKLTDQYKPYFKTSPDLSLRIKDRMYWIDVRGLVQKPGRYLVDRQESIDHVIGLADGLNHDNAPEFVLIQKGQKRFVMDLKRYYLDGEEHTQVLSWVGGEVIFFQKELDPSVKDKLAIPIAEPVYVMGEVRKPGAYTVQSGSDFVSFLKQSDGFTEAADLDRIEIIHGTSGAKRSVTLSWDDLRDAPAPQGGDVIMVHADRRTKYDRRIAFGTLMASLLTAFASVALAAYTVRTVR